MMGMGTSQPISIMKNIEINKTPRQTGKKFKYNPLRILIIEPGGRYCRTVWCALGLGLVHVLIGSTVMSVLIYSLMKGDTHAALCALAYHFFSAEAILSLNYANGWSTPMRLRHRRLTHTLLQMCAVALAITGTALVTIDKGISTSPHALTGLIASILACIAFLSGACGLFGGQYLKLLHITFGIPTFIVSSVSFCFGLFTKEFEDWAGSTVVFILSGFIFFYTTFIMITCLIKFAMRL